MRRAIISTSAAAKRPRHRERMALSEIDRSRERLISGVLRFQCEVYPKQKDRYRKVAREGQKPHALFITCADSRIDPEAITQSGPGEIFVSRNIGNLVPSHGGVLGGVSAIVEYAVAALRVSHIVVCGHTDCGAIVGLLHPEKVAAYPIVKSWLRNGEAALSTVRRRNTAADEASALEELTEETVLLQLDHLRTHPSVAGSLAEGKIALSGWVYDIAHGLVRIYSQADRKFLPVTAENAVGSGAAARP